MILTGGEMTGAAVATTLIGSHRVTADPDDMLLHYALGEIPCYVSGEGSEVAWCRHSHRGVHLLSEIKVPKSQRRYVFSPRFEFRIDSAFEEVVRECADLSRTGFTWITPALIEGYVRLHRLGFAHSYEAWAEGRLAGGCFGVHVGAWVSVESMFHHEAHASKAAYGRALQHFKERGVSLVDSNPVADPARNYGEEWLPQWQFEERLRSAMARPLSLIDGGPTPLLPAPVRRLLGLARVVRKVTGRAMPTPERTPAEAP